VIERHGRDIRQIVGHLKSQATRRLKEAGLWHVDARPIWGAHGWNVFLDDPTAVQRAIRYVEGNPEKEGKKPQKWSIVTPFDLAAARQSASQATRLNQGVMRQKRRMGGAALRSQQRKQQRKEPI
jgi:hypothetical protein